MIQKSRKGDFGSQNPKHFLGEHAPAGPPLEACTFGTHLGKLVSIYPFKPKDPHTNSPD